MAYRRYLIPNICCAMTRPVIMSWPRWSIRRWRATIIRGNTAQCLLRKEMTHCWLKGISSNRRTIDNSWDNSVKTNRWVYFKPQRLFFSKKPSSYRAERIKLFIFQSPEIHAPYAQIITWKKSPATIMLKNTWICCCVFVIEWQKRVTDQENTLFWGEESTQIPVKIDPYFFHCFTTDTIQQHLIFLESSMIWGERAPNANVVVIV